MERLRSVLEMSNEKVMLRTIRWTPVSETTRGWVIKLPHLKL